MDEDNSRKEIIKKAGQRYAATLKEHAAKGKEHKKARITAYEDYQSTLKGDSGKGRK